MDLVKFLFSTLLFSAFTGNAAAAIWSHSHSEYCFQQWMKTATKLLNKYPGKEKWNANKPYHFDQYGQWQGKHATTTYPPVNFNHYQNRYHWMWQHYRYTFYGWSISQWNQAQVPPLHDFVVQCMREHQPTPTYSAPGWRGHNPWAWWFWDDKFLDAHTAKTVHLFKQPHYRKLPLNYCLDAKGECGLVVAKRYCKLRGFAKVVAFVQEKNVTRSRYIRSNYVCTKPNCDAFSWIRCAK